jgi:hypothetical protein
MKGCIEQPKGQFWLDNYRASIYVLVFLEEPYQVFIAYLAKLKFMISIN